MPTYSVIYICEESTGIVPLCAEDEAAAWKVARNQFPGCKLALIDEEDEDD